MIRGAAFALALVMAQPASSQDETKEGRLVLPSGLTAQLQEMLTSAPERPGGGPVYRFRFVGPDFTGAEDVARVTKDLEYLCNVFAVPRLPASGPSPGRIVVSLADKPSEFGMFDPGVMQVFESFSVQDQACIWEMF